MGDSFVTVFGLLASGPEIPSELWSEISVLLFITSLLQLGWVYVNEVITGNPLRMGYGCQGNQPPFRGLESPWKPKSKRFRKLPRARPQTPQGQRLLHLEFSQTSAWASLYLVVHSYFLISFIINSQSTKSTGFLNSVSGPSKLITSEEGVTGSSDL